jgi:hypothetical protein
VFAIHGGPQIVHDMQVRHPLQRLLHQWSGLNIARKDHWQTELRPQAYSRLGCSHELHHLHHPLDLAPIHAPGDENHVWPELSHALNALVGLAPVIQRQHVHHDRSRPQSCAFRALGGHASYQPHHHDLQPAARGAGGKVYIRPSPVPSRANQFTLLVQQLPARELLHLRDGVSHPDQHVIIRRLHGGGCLSP